MKKGCKILRNIKDKKTAQRMLKRRGLFVPSYRWFTMNQFSMWISGKKKFLKTTDIG